MSEVLIKRIQFANVAGFLLVHDHNAILVDTGHRKDAVEKFKKKLNNLGLLPEQVSLIILTHTHFDHAGGAREIKALTGAKLAVHHSEAAFLEKGRTPFPKGTRWKGKLIRTVGIMFAPWMANYPPVKPDILIDMDLDLKLFGIPGKVIYTPGHTAGSVSVFLDQGQAIVGDNVMGITEKEHFPPFANDQAGVIRSWEKYISEGMEIVYPAHGIKVAVAALEQEIEAARRRYIK